MESLPPLLLILSFLFLITCGAHNQSRDDGLTPNHEDLDFQVAISSKLKNSATDDSMYEEITPWERKRVKRIALGSSANPGDFPHQVSIQYKATGHFCSASIIHPLLLLSVAHCYVVDTDMHVPPHIQATAGVHSLTASNSTVYQVRSVTHVFPHQKYNQTTYDSNIAILVLNQSLEFNDFVSPIKLWDPKWNLPGQANISGWGYRWGKSSGGHLIELGRADSLIVATVPIVDRENCTEKWKSQHYNISENMMCAGGAGADACLGDSGGPLTCARNGASGEEERYLCGIISWGASCSRRQQSIPGVYTDVTKYAAWIEKFKRTLGGPKWTIGPNRDDGFSFDEVFDFDGILPPAIITAQLIKAFNDDDDYDWGDHNHSLLSVVSKVTGGNVAETGDFRHQVSLRNKVRRGEPFCGATIIHPLLLLSAAHCFQREINQPPNIHAVTGMLSLTALNGNEQGREVIQVFKHPKFSDKTWENDIAILVLNESLKFNDFVRSVPVRGPTWKLPGMAHTSGWGKIQSVRMVNELRAAQVPIVDIGNCTEQLNSTGLTINENTICAGGDGFSACEADSGGPLTCVRNGTDGEEERYLCGIASWRFSCQKNERGLPDVYTDVSKYTSWIEKFMRTWWRQYWRIWLGIPRDGPSDCPAGKFYCSNNRLCIPAKLVCNGRNDCNPLEDWDEQNCTSITCSKGKFRCNSTQVCIPAEYVCDGDNDCIDGSDELGCNLTVG